MRKVLTFLVTLLPFARPALAQTQTPEPASARGVARQFEIDHKKVDDVLWYLKLGDVAAVDKVELTSKPPRMKNPTGQGAGNPMIIPAYVFTPKNLRGKAPLIVFVHGGVHGDFETSYAHVVRELIDQGYVIIAPEYRGSTGSGEEQDDQK